MAGASLQEGCDQGLGTQSCWRAQGKVFTGDDILSRTPVDQADFPGRDRVSPQCRGTGVLTDPKPETWVPRDEFCVPGGGR